MGGARFALTSGRDAATPEGVRAMRYGERASARSFVAALLRMTGESGRRRMTKKRVPKQYFVILSGTKCSEESRACAWLLKPSAPPILPPL